MCEDRTLIYKYLSRSGSIFLIIINHGNSHPIGQARHLNISGRQYGTACVCVQPACVPRTTVLMRARGGLMAETE